MALSPEDALTALLHAHRKAAQEAAIVAQHVGRRYELQVVSHHARAFEHTVWHNDVIPEEELFQCGFIHDFNRHRLLRLAARAEAIGRDGPRFRDYGMDFLAKDVNGVYHAGQAKFRSRGYIGANDLGTFQIVVYGRTQQPGYIYTTVPLEVNLREDVQNSRGMLIHCRLPYEGEEIEVAEPAAEIDNELRPYQREAIDAICADADVYGETANRKALQLFCGGGKTLIAGHALRRRDDALIVCIAPLKMSVDQLRTRLAPFLPRHKVLLVDSDDGGTTDLEEVRAAVQRAGRMAIFSTFKSAEAVLSKVEFGEDAFLLVDEVHNMVSNDAIVAFADGFNHSLLMSATLPEELYERMRVAKAFEFGMAEAIEGGFCCDYRVYLPLLQMREEGAEGGRAIVTVPELLAGDDQTLAAKALFLVTGMLMRGSRRCIAYMGSKAECDAFLGVLGKVVETHHGLAFWGGKIDCDVGRDERSQLLRDFQAGSDAILRVLTSVRILDEAIDVVRCDSQFVAHVGKDASDIRTVQRMCRGIRLDAMNVAKVNTLFMWSEEWGAALNALSLLRTMDVEFHTKVRVGSVDYEACAERSVREIIGLQAGRLTDYVAAKCLSWDEIFARNVALFARFYAAHARVPKTTELFENQKIGLILNRFRNQRTKMAPERRATLDAAMPGWDAVDEARVAAIAAALTEEEKVALFARFYAAHQRVPKRAETFEGKKIGGMLGGFRNQRTTMASGRRAALDAAMPGWDAVDDPFSKNVALFARFYAAHQRVPKFAEAFEDKKIGMMLNTFRSQRATMAPERKAALDVAMPGWNAVDEAKVAGKAEALSEEEKVALFARFYAAHQRVPKRAETFEGKKIGTMLNMFRNERTMAPGRRAALNAAMPGWDADNDPFPANVALFARFYTIHQQLPTIGRQHTFEGKNISALLAKFRTRQERLTPKRRAALNVAMPGWDTDLDPFPANVALFARFYAANQRVPKFAEAFEDKKIGMMLNSFRNKRTTMAPGRRAALDAAMPGWDVVDEARVAGIKAALTEEEKVALFARFYAAHQRVPKKSDTFEGKMISKMLGVFRSHRATMASARRAALDAAMPGWDAVKAARAV